MKWLRASLAFLILFPMTSAVTNAAQQQPQELTAPQGYKGFTPGFIVLEGQVATDTLIGLVLAVDGNPNPHGWFFTAPRFEDHPLDGRWTDDGVVLDGKQGDRLSLKYLRQHPSAKPDEPLSLYNITTLTGQWSTPSGEQQIRLQMEFSRGPLVNGRWYDFGTSDAEVERNAQAFLRAVEEGNARAAARHIDFPLSTFLGKQKVKVRSAQEFLRLHNKIIPPGTADRIRMAMPHDMFCRMGNAMVLQGDVWFSGKGAVSVWLPTSARRTD